MKIIGLTGGIGSGKSTVARWFLEKGVPVYNSDDRARHLLNSDPELRQKLISEFGEQAYADGIYNRAYLAAQVFGNQDRLEQLNRIVHPAVFEDFRKWKSEQEAVFVLKESAILIESGSWRDCDLIISVVADPELRITRVAERDGLSREQIQKRMDSQCTDKQRIEKSDYIIFNNSGLDELKSEFERVYSELLKQYKRG